MINNKKIGMIACCNIDGLIGYDGKIPWHHPIDLKRFKSLTMDSTLIMGSKTYLSLPKKSLSGRIIHVLHNWGSDYKDERHVDVVHHNDMIQAIKSAPTENIWIAGGSQIYSTALGLRIPDFIDLTIINGVHVTNVADRCKIQKEKSTYLPTIGYEYRVISEIQNEEDSSLFHRRYEIRPAWAW